MVGIMNQPKRTPKRNQTIYDIINIRPYLGKHYNSMYHSLYIDHHQAVCALTSKKHTWPIEWGSMMLVQRHRSKSHGWVCCNSREIDQGSKKCH